jgi:hypothetical protein
MAKMFIGGSNEVAAASHVEKLQGIERVETEGLEVASSGAGSGFIAIAREAAHSRNLVPVRKPVI